MSAQQAFSAVSFDIYRKEENLKSFDMTTGPALTMPSHHALNFAWGEHCICMCTVGTYMYCVAGAIIVPSVCFSDVSFSCYGDIYTYT